VEGMILAAGLGTRLGTITRDLPKALVPVAGIPMLERVARGLAEAGVDRLIVNTHHFADRVVQFTHSRGCFGLEVVFSPEPDGPLETGGGLLNAAPLFRSGMPFFLHNADILTDLPLHEMYAAHRQEEPLATLMVMRRQSSRYLLFDDDGLLGRVDELRGLRIQVRTPRGEIRPLAFGGVHVIDPGIFALLEERGAFSIFNPYLRLAGGGHRILAWEADASRWLDIGKPEQLAEAERRMERSLP
jgi:N-acetyl-alpha-D-muramate 1-phosphate uridylyltransferase